jgi:hypothetical protein
MMKKKVVKKKPESLCFYDWVVCKDCELVYTCTPSTKNGKFYLNILKKCTQCGKEIKQLKRWKDCGLLLNDKNYPKIIGQRLLLDMSSQNFKDDMFQYSKERLVKIWGKKFVNKIFNQKVV